MGIPYLNLQAQYQALAPDIRSAVEAVFHNAHYVLGPEVQAFEYAFAAACGTAGAIAVNTGTSALHLALLALGVGPGDEVLVPGMTFVATAAAVTYTGATPVFVDVEPSTMTLDIAAAATAITTRTVGIIPVHLYGHPADLTGLSALCERHGLFLLEDACQAHLASWKGRKVGSWGRAAAFSFYPGKNLGAAGEGGAITSSDAELLSHCRCLRDWGQTERYCHTYLGFNYRMEGLQGAILNLKLLHLEAWTEARRRVAQTYTQGLEGLPECTLPAEHPEARHVYHIYALRHPHRETLRTHLTQQGIQTGLHYPLPLHLQPCFAHLGYRVGQLPVSETIARSELSLPIYPELKTEQLEQVCEALRQACFCTTHP